ncbi:MAG: ABC transporter ATP-binding protein [Mesotoga sp.]|uniref:ABC transporter ATP-binding protein n=2 Tax=Mesotoga sp. TaxID=2053577 RepID=UPI002608CBA1|nr:ABC transporter ATP-binding protein [Mesotoga sp.]MDD4825723.1 ABC transporter ATP-binding protein [Mesotoga sp.]
MRLRIENLHKGFDGEKIIDGLSYSLEGNFFLTILGSSGSGKTTLLRIISGILKPERGTVDVHSERLGFVFQDDRLIPWLTAAQNISIVAPESNPIEFLSFVGLKGQEDKYPSQLSGGMRRRLNIARALAFNPDLILMDEPFGSLDIVIKDRLIDDIQKIWIDRKISVIMVTHDPSEAARLSTDIMLVRDKFSKIESIHLGNPVERSPDEKDKVARDLLSRMKESSSFVQ